MSNCQTPVLSLGLGVDFILACHNNDNNHNNPHLNFLTGTVLGDKEQGIKGKTELEFDTEDQVLFTYKNMII